MFEVLDQVSRVLSQDRDVWLCRHKTLILIEASSAVTFYALQLGWCVHLNNGDPEDSLLGANFSSNYS